MDLHLTVFRPYARTPLTGTRLGQSSRESALSPQESHQAPSIPGTIRRCIPLCPFGLSPFDATHHNVVKSHFRRWDALIVRWSRTAGRDGSQPAGWAARFWPMLPNIGANLLREDEIGDILEDHGFVSVRTKNFGTLHGCGPTRITPSELGSRCCHRATADAGLRRAPPSAAGTPARHPPRVHTRRVCDAALGIEGQLEHRPVVRLHSALGGLADEPVLQRGGELEMRLLVAVAPVFVGRGP